MCVYVTFMYNIFAIILSVIWRVWEKKIKTQKYG